MSFSNNTFGSIYLASAPKHGFSESVFYSFKELFGKRASRVWPTYVMCNTWPPMIFPSRVSFFAFHKQSIFFWQGRLRGDGQRPAKRLNGLFCWIDLILSASDRPDSAHGWTKNRVTIIFLLGLERIPCQRAAFPASRSAISN